jgi:hypothetical protein
MSAKIPQRGSVLVIVMITLIFTTFALVAFIDKASSDFLVESRVVEARRLRAEAYSALEATLAVLEDFRQVGGGLHSPAEGWHDPLAFAEWTPAEGRTVTVSFEDESAKLSLPRADAATLTKLFESWDMTHAEAERLADALMGWMKGDHIYETSVSPDYERGQIPYLPPARPLRSFQELAVIEVAREVFFEDGQPNALWHRFTRSVSLFNYRQPNINGANPDVLTAVGQFDEFQQEKMNEYLTGAGAYKSQGPGWFKDVATARNIAGAIGSDSGGFGTSISALRILITVQDGLSQFHLSAVVAPLQNGATTVQTNATAARNQASAAAGQGSGTQPQPSGTPAASTNPNAVSNAKKLNYPFTLLEIRENDEIPPPPPPPPDPSI